MSLREGDQFHHYQIRAHIAQGGTGDVYRALDTQTGGEVALKIPTRSAILDPRQYERFLRELEALNVLQDPAVQHRITSGRWNDTPYLVTDLIEGILLRSEIKRHGPLLPDRATALTRKIADGLRYCHDQEVVHRDLKPENIFVTDGDLPVIIDFGLALTQARPESGRAGGTPEYMAPEQIEGGRCDKRTDVYALGIILYEMLMDQPPFVSDDPFEVMNMHLYKAVPRLDKLKSNFTPELATVVARCMQRAPDERYPDMSALIHDLDHLDQVDTSGLAALCAAPPTPPLYKNQYVQALLTSAALMVGIVLLALFLAALKH